MPPALQEKMSRYQRTTLRTGIYERESEYGRERQSDAPVSLGMYPGLAWQKLHVLCLAGWLRFTSQAETI